MIQDASCGIAKQLLRRHSARCAPHGAIRQQAIAEAPAKWSAHQSQRSATEHSPACHCIGFQKNVTVNTDQSTDGTQSHSAFSPRRHERWGLGFESHSRRGYLCVAAALRRAEESYRLRIGLRNRRAAEPNTENRNLLHLLICASLLCVATALTFEGFAFRALSCRIPCST
jgi:hypothetical protein